MEQKFILEIKQRLDKCNWDFEKKTIIKEIVEQLRSRFYSDTQIKGLFETFLIEGQTNIEMIRNNQHYLELLEEILNS